MRFLADIVLQAITSRVRHLTPTISIQVDVFVCAPNEGGYAFGGVFLFVGYPSTDDMSWQRIVCFISAHES